MQKKKSDADVNFICYFTAVASPNPVRQAWYLATSCKSGKEMGLSKIINDTADSENITCPTELLLVQMSETVLVLIYYYILDSKLSPCSECCMLSSG